MNGKRLGMVVRIRELQERVARGAVVRERAEVARRERARAEVVASVERGANEPPIVASRFVAHRAMLGAGVRQIGTAGESVERARFDLGCSIDDWTVAAQRLDGVERLEERERSAAQAEADRIERAVIDDIVVMRWDATGARSAS